MSEHCPECGALWRDGVTCADHFHQMLFWENEDSANWAVHHLTVLCYHLQHPSLYAPDGLEHATGLLIKFVDEGVDPRVLRVQMRDEVEHHGVLVLVGLRRRGCEARSVELVEQSRALGERGPSTRPEGDDLVAAFLEDAAQLGAVG